MGKAENEQVAMINGVQPKGGKEQRSEPRYMVTWRVGVSMGGGSLHYGRAKDISTIGMSVLNDLNLEPGARLTLSIHVPAMSRACASKALIVRGKVVYTVYDSHHQCFRAGVSFTEFEQPSDRAFLEERLASHHVLVPEFVGRRSTDGF